MELKRLGDYVNIKTGKLDANASSENGKYPFFTCSVKNLWIDNFAYDCECVLIAGNGDLNVKYYEGKFNAYQRTYIVESDDKNILDVRYLYYFMSKYIDILRNNSIGGVIKYIKLGDLTEVFIPIPKLETQKKIVEVLDKAQGLIDARKEQIRLMDELIQSVFYEMFSKNENYPTKSIENVCPAIYDCPHSTPKYSDVKTSYRCLRTSNLGKGYIDWCNLAYVNEDVYHERNNRYKPNIGDVVYSREGAILGIAALVNEDKHMCLGQRLMIFKLDNAIVNSIFFWMMLNSSFVRRQVELNVGGAAAPRINIKDIKKFEIFLPPIELQNEFAERIHKIEEMKNIMRISDNEIRNNNYSLLKKTFKGELFGGL